MARPLRIDHPGGWTHAMSRGINKNPIFIEDGDRAHFLELLERRWDGSGSAFTPMC